ncbi:MAG: PBP1A family penicillin-binding protein [Patescibacteria group bacterium]|nr:PBP1A family penicillin-binding protein [Patescibacteria group bacterium]
MFKMPSSNQKKVINIGNNGGNKPKINKERQRKIIIFLLGIVAFFVLVFGGIFAYYAKDLPSPRKINSKNTSESTKIFDRSGETLLYEIHGGVKRTLIPLSEMPEYIQEATISAEDKNFYHHFGFDPIGIIRSALKNTKSDERVGGSTITQQLVKNTALSAEKTYTRKIKELILSVEIEALYTKKDILQMYLNEIPYGSNAFGIESAAETFYGKKAKDLTLAESATLAAIPQAPTYYSPYGSNTDALKARQEWILDRMVDDKYITKEEANKAKQEKFAFVEKQEGIIAPHFVMYVKDLLVEEYGEKEVQKGGYKVYTTLDMRLQKIAERVIPEGVDRNYGYGATNAALAAVDPKTGEILAMQGSKDYFDKENEGNVNVTIRDRQPGSSFKPIVYALALKKGYTPDTILYDVPTDFGNNYKPSNYDGQTHGPVTMRQALTNSLNIPAVKTLYLAGLENTIDFAHQLGITTLGDSSNYGLSLVLGGGEVKLLDEVSAYSVFANDGLKNDKKAILKVIDRKGKVIQDNSKADAKRIVEDQVARQLSSILSDTNARQMVFGSAPNLRLADRQVAVKTGTTENFKDAWTVGYTPSLAAGVWVGNNSGAEMNSGADGSVVAAPIWHSFMEQAMEGQPVEEFKSYDPIKVDKPVLMGKSGSEEKVRIEKTTKKLATDDCPPESVEEVTIRSAHSILFYVEKDNPRGEAPKNPAADPQYNNWESAVQAWAGKDNKGITQIPKETTDVCSPVKKPKISITSPTGGLIKEGTITVSASVTAPNGVKNVDFTVDGTSIGSASTEPYSAEFYTGRFENGFHTVSASVTDKIGQKASSQVTIETKVDRASSISLSSSGSGNLTKQDFPISLTATVAYSGTLQKVQFLLNGAIYDEVGSPTGNSFSTSLSYPGTGSYSVQAAAVDETGRAIFSNQVSFSIAAASTPEKPTTPQKTVPDKSSNKKSSFLFKVINGLAFLNKIEFRIS